MPAYRLYRLDGAGKFMSAEWIEATDDSAALNEARQLIDGERFELWDRNRLVKRSRPAQP